MNYKGKTLKTYFKQGIYAYRERCKVKRQQASGDRLQVKKNT
jgi:hypothetical protein